MRPFTQRHTSKHPVEHVDSMVQPLRPLRIALVDYSEGQVTERADISAEECSAFLQSPGITWIHVQGDFEPEELARLARSFELHALALEDVIVSGHRPKAEIYDAQLFLILSRPVWQGETLLVEQVSLFFSENLVISFYDGAEIDPFAAVRKRLRQYNGWLRNRRADYLLYDLVDVVIDAGFPVLEILGDRIEALEEDLLGHAGKETLAKLHRLRRDLLALRRMIWPHREVVNFLLREEFPLIQTSTKLYLRDCYDHSVHFIELLEAYRDMSASMLDVYLSRVSQRLNENMRVLTVISTIFMPLTFITSLYGMNFDRSAGPWNMPELGWPYGYLFVWGIMLMLILGMLAFFRRMKWL